MKGDWNELKGRLKQKFAILTDDDVRCSRKANKTNFMAASKTNLERQKQRFIN